MLCLLAFGCGGPEEVAKQPPSLDVSKAAPYRVLGKKTWNFMNAERGTVFIVAPARRASRGAPRRR